MSDSSFRPSARTGNRLTSESSPYLRQHRNNPVDWYPWGEEALERARRENKPILLSVGYSACHWCHVMAHECFEDPAIAERMNRDFVNIKVDREERPDLDQIYQKVAQIFTQGGGWPLTVFLTPELKPFFGGTYFPPEDRSGRPGFPRVLESLSQAYREKSELVARNAEQLMDAMAELELEPGPPTTAPTLADLRAVGEGILSVLDWENGGLGGAPKFPNAMTFSFLWRIGFALGWNEAMEGAIVTLVRMAQGGIYDQLGGGFHRYSVDATWSVPHFEKMLYDNALLLRLYAEVLLADANGPRKLLTPHQRELFNSVLEETVGYLLREMRGPEGAFFSAQDADSEGEEGRYFVWRPEDLLEILAPDEARAFSLRFGVSPEGNFEGNASVLSQAMRLEEVAARLGARSLEETRAWVNSARRKCLEARGRRVPPGRDDKVLTSWNALAISGLAWAGAALREAGRRESADSAARAAEEAFEAITRRMSRAEGRLWSCRPEGGNGINGYLDDYAFLAMASLDLVRFQSGDESSVAAGRVALTADWVRTIIRHFSDPRGGGYYFTSDDHEKLVRRPKTLLDQAIPSGTAVALECMAALAELDWEGQGAFFEEELSRQAAGLFSLAERIGTGMGELLCAFLIMSQGPLVVSGAGEQAARLVFHPHLFRKPEAPSGSWQVCHHKTCSLLPTELKAARNQLAARLA